MRNRALHRRLTAIEAEFDQAAKTIERERMPLAERKTSAEEAERAYKRLMNSCSTQSRSEDWTKLTPNEAMARYLREVGRTTPPLRRRMQPGKR